MDIKKVLYSQYVASLTMLKNAINSADDDTWYEKPERNHPFWHIVYHTLFCTDCYLGKDADSFIPWDKHRKDFQFLGKNPIPPYNEPDTSNPYNKSEILEYFEKIYSTLKEKIEEADLEADSGFYWVPVNKLEMQLYNIRHIQHHAGQLAYLLREKKDTGIAWEVKCKDE
jgi:hypothetical protein